MASFATILIDQRKQGSSGLGDGDAAPAKAAAPKKLGFDVPKDFQARYLKDQLKEVDTNIGKVTQTLIRMEGELKSLDRGNLAKKDIIALVTSSKAIVAKLEYLKSVFLQGSEGLSREYTYSPYEKFMNTPDPEIDQMIKTAVQEIDGIDIAEGLQLDAELSEKAEAHKTNLEMLRPLLAQNIINSRGSAIAHIESILAIFNGMVDLRTEDEGVFQIAARKLGEPFETGFSNPERAEKLGRMIEKANQVIGDLFAQRAALENAISELEDLDGWVEL